jgi:hypothetical protein
MFKTFACQYIDNNDFVAPGGMQQGVSPDMSCATIPMKTTITKSRVDLTSSVSCKATDP